MPLRLDLNAITDPALRRQLEAIQRWAVTEAVGASASASPTTTAQSASEPFVTSAADIQLLDENYLYWAALATDTVLDALARVRWIESAGQFQFDVGTATLAVLESTGHFGVGTLAPSAMVHGLAGSDSTAAIIAQAHSTTQAADLVAALNSSGSAVASINAEGRITAGGPAPVVSGALFSADGATTPGNGAAYYMKNVSGHLWRVLLDNTVSRVTISPHSMSNWLLRLSTNAGDSEAVLAQSWATDVVSFAARAFPGQTAAVQEWQNSSGTNVASMTDTGGLTVQGFTLPPGAASLYVLASDSAGVGTWVDPDTLGITVAAGWTDDGTVVRLTTATDQVGLGMTTPAAKLGITAASGEQCIRLTNNAASSHILRTIEIFDGTHANSVFYMQKNGFVKLVIPSIPDGGDETGVGVTMGDTTARNYAAYNGQQCFQAQPIINATVSPNAYTQGYDSDISRVHGNVDYVHGYFCNADMGTGVTTIGQRFGSFVSSLGDSAGQCAIASAAFVHFWATDSGDMDNSGGTTITNVYGFRMDEQTYDVSGITNFYGLASAYNCLIRNDSYLYWATNLTTGVGSRAAGVRWNSGGSTLDFSVGTTNRLTLSATTAAVNAALTANTFNGLTISSSTGTLTVANGKTLTASNTLTMTATDGSTAAFGAGGTVAYVANKLSVFAATTSAELAGVISDETGSGALVFANTPTLVTPVLGTPTSGTLTNCTGLPISTGVSGLGTNVATFLATPSSANLAAALTDETGTGVAVFGTNPTLTGATVSGDKLLHSGVLATIKSTQTTAPTVAAGAALGSGPTVSVQAGSTDICGLINLTAGTSTTTGTLCTLTFNGTYGGAPKMVIIGYAGTASAVPRPYVSSTTTTTFVVTAAVAPTASAVCSLYYFVIE